MCTILFEATLGVLKDVGAYLEANMEENLDEAVTKTSL